MRGEMEVGVKGRWGRGECGEEKGGGRESVEE